MERRNLCTLPRGGWLALFTLAITLLGGATPAEAQAGGPITELECEVTAPDSVVLNWVNDGPYTEIRIIIDGVLWDTLGGAETSKELNGITLSKIGDQGVQVTETGVTIPYLENERARKASGEIVG